MLIYIFTFLGFFSIILLNLPSEFLAVQQLNTDIQSDKTASQMFEAANITAYTQSATFQMNYPDQQIESMGLPNGHNIEFNWNIVPVIYLSTLQVRHTWEGLFGWWTEYEILHVADQFEVTYPTLGVVRDDLSGLWENEIAGSTFIEWDSNGYHVAAFIYPNSTDQANLVEAWDYGYMNFTISYEVDWNRTTVNAFNLMSQIMLFQSPDLGLGAGVHNTILNAFVALPLWIMIIILIVKLIFALYPTSSGVPD